MTKKTIRSPAAKAGAATPVHLHDRQTMVMIGDSITDCGRRGEKYPLWGDGYVKIFADLLLCRRPTWHNTILNRGIGGSTVIELQERWTDDVLAHRPDVVTILIGINDASDVYDGSGDPVMNMAYCLPMDELTPSIQQYVN